MRMVKRCLLNERSMSHYQRRQDVHIIILCRPNNSMGTFQDSTAVMMVANGMSSVHTPSQWVFGFSV